MASEFLVYIQKPSGTDYSTAAAAEAALQCNLTAAATMVFDISSETGAVSDAAAVTLYRGGVSQGVTATVKHVTAADTQVLLQSISNTSFSFQVGDQWRVNASNYVTISSTGDSAIISMECYAGQDSSQLEIDGWTTSSTNYIEIYTPLAEQHDGTADTGYRIVGNFTGGAIQIYESHVLITGLAAKNTNESAFSIFTSATATYNIRIDRCLFYDSGGWGIELGSACCGSGYNALITNCFIVGNANDGVTCGNSAYVDFYNCAVCANINAGFNIWEVGNTSLYNCYSGGNDVSEEGWQDYEGSDNLVNFTKCASSDTSGSEVGLRSIAYSAAGGAKFVDVGAGTEDLHIQNSSALADVGNDYSGVFTDDIDSQTRPSGGHWDIGGDQITFPAVGQPMALRNMNVPQVKTQSWRNKHQAFI